MAQSFSFPGISAPTAPFALLGGTYQLNAVLTSQGPVVLQQLSADGLNWCAPVNNAGVANSIPLAASPGAQQIRVPPGQYRIYVPPLTNASVTLAQMSG